MINYITRRLIILPFIVFGVTVLVFGMLMMLSPYQRLSTYVSDPKQVKGQNMDAMVEKHGLNDPFYQQYGRWIKGIMKGDFGWSESAGQPVSKAIMSRFPATLELVLFAIIPVVLGGIWLGVFSAVKHNKAWDHIIRVLATVGWSFPTFVFALLMLMIFYGVLGWFPPGRLGQDAAEIVRSAEFVRYTGLNVVDSLLNGNLFILWDSIRHIIAPIITLSVIRWAYILRITRSSMLETLGKDYIRTARSKGVEEKVVVNKHARRNALIPVVTVAGPMILAMLGGVVITETIFNYRGIGQFAAQAAQQLDYAAILGVAMYFSFLLILTNLIVDVSYAVIDPRIRLE